MRQSPTIAERLRGADDSVARFEALFADAPVAFQVFRPDGHCEYCNPAFRNLFGSVPPPEYNILKDDIAAQRGCLELIRRAFKGEVVRIPPVWYDPRDLEQIDVREGRNIAAEAVVLPLTDDSGIVRHVAVIFNDVTAQMELLASEDKLRQQTELLQAVFDNMAEGMVMVDQSGMPRMWNNAAAKILHMPLPASPISQWPKDFGAFLPDQTTPWPMDELPLVRALKGENVDGVEMFFRFPELPQGVWVTVSARPLTDVHGRFRGAVSVFRDVTTERAARLTIQRAQRDLRQVIECSPDGIAVSRMGRLIYTNTTFVGLLGFASASDLLGQDIRTFVHPDDLPAVVQRVRSLGTGTSETELRYRKRDGNYVTVELSMTRLVDFEGAPAVLGIARDLTERKKLQGQHLISDRLASLGTLAAGAVHEINNPLASLVTNLDVAIKELSRPGHEGAAATSAGDRSASVLDCLRDASEAADRIRQVVGDLRLFSRIDQEQSGAVDLCSVLDSSIRMATTEIRHRARLVKDYEKLPLVHGSEVRLGQVFLNLLINAVQAIPEGRADEHEIRVSAGAQEAEHVVVEVKDTGVGIEPEIRERIFEPFFTTKAVGKGTGLGLAICQKIVTECGGHIEVESEVGKGSVFRVTLRTCHKRRQPVASPR